MHIFKGITSILKKIGLLLFTVATSFCSYSQETNTDDELDALIDDLFFNDVAFMDEVLASLNTYNYIYSSVSYNSNTYFSGRDSGIDQLNVIPQMSYYHSSGFNASVSGIYYSEFTPHWDFTNIAVGYSSYIDKKQQFSYNVGYSRFFFSDHSDTFTNFLDVGLGYRNKKQVFGSKIAASYLFGSDQSFQFISSTYGNITLTRQESFVLKLKPRLNFIVAQQTISLEKIIPIAGQSPTVTTFNFNVFDLLNTQLSFPVSLTTTSWDFELAYTLNIPKAVAIESNLGTTGYASISIGYLFDLGKFKK